MRRHTTTVPFARRRHFMNAMFVHAMQMYDLDRHEDDGRLIWQDYDHSKDENEDTRCAR